MKISEIYTFLDAMSPFSLQEKWDNSGLVIGSMDREIEQIYIALDVDNHMLDSIKPNSLIITHHPLIFGGLTFLDLSKYPANLIETMIKKDISLIAMHTNFDKTHLNRYVFEHVLGFKLEKQSDFICKTNGIWTKEELIELLKNKFKLETLKVVAPKDKITSIAMITGSGASLMDEIDADCFLTGDIKYHDAIKAISQNLMMVDIGHYESERYFVDILAEHLQVLPILAIISNSKNPFSFLK
ncbi:MAG: Nif3-like dinuclear metal center hexameric protein [Sulfurovaceae bacterium]|nr:Nif3-like dinuclear metal center hexameric protein [Sulfurovaceae bacterium]